MTESAFARALRRAILLTTSALIIGVAVWTAADGLSPLRLTVGVIVAGPLAVSLPKLRAGDRRAFAWSTLALIPLLVLTMTETIANPRARAWAALGLCAGFALFMMLIAYLRATRPPSPA